MFATVIYLHFKIYLCKLISVNFPFITASLIANNMIETEILYLHLYKKKISKKHILRKD